MGFTSLSDPRIRLLAGLKQGTVYRLEFNNDPTFLSTEGHWWFVLNKNPNSSEIVILSCATSQNTPLRLANSSNDPGRAHKGIVQATWQDYVEFTQTTLIDCNRAKTLSFDTLVKMYADGKLQQKSDASQEFIEKLVKAFEEGIGSTAEEIALVK